MLPITLGVEYIFTRLQHAFHKQSMTNDFICMHDYRFGYTINLEKLKHIIYKLLMIPMKRVWLRFNPLNSELNPVCHLLTLLGAHHILHVSRIRVNDLRHRSSRGPTTRIWIIVWNNLTDCLNFNNHTIISYSVMYFII
jgi:hypothetical protein